MKAKPLLKDHTIEDAENDVKGAVKLFQYRAGENAFYIPGLINWSYLPYSVIDKAYARTREYSSNGCCGSGVEKLPVLVLEYGEDRQILQFGSMEEARNAEDVVNERLQASGK